jgi:hypothetical protein
MFKEVNHAAAISPIVIVEWDDDRAGCFKIELE